MKSSQSSILPTRTVFFLTALSAVFLTLMSSPRAATPSNQTFQTMVVSRLIPDASEGEQLRDREADFVRGVLADADSRGLDIGNIDELARLLEPYYPDLLVVDDPPQATEYSYKWDDDLGWVRVCEVPDELILAGPLELNPIVIKVRNGMILN